MNAAIRPALAALALCAAVLAAFARSPEPPLSGDEISAVELAAWIRARRPGLLVLDTRSGDAMERDGLPGARSAADFEGDAIDTIVLYGDRRLDEAPPLRGNTQRVLRLHGGIEAWNEEVLFPAIRADASERQKREFASRAQLSRYFGGSPRVLDPGTDSPRSRSRRGC